MIKKCKRKLDNPVVVLLSWRTPQWSVAVLMTWC